MLQIHPSMNFHGSATRGKCLYATAEEMPFLSSSVYAGPSSQRTTKNLRPARIVAVNGNDNPMRSGDRGIQITFEACTHSKSKPMEPGRSTGDAIAKEHPEYVQRNAAFVKKYKARRRKSGFARVSSTSCDLRLSIWNQTSNVSITHVSPTSRDIFVTVSRNEA